MRLIRLRNRHAAFQGAVRIGRTPQSVLALRGQADSAFAELISDFAAGRSTVRHGAGAASQRLVLGRCATSWTEAPRDIPWHG